MTFLSRSQRRKAERQKPKGNPQTYYALPIWNRIRNNVWLKLANDIPKIKVAIMKNQMTIKHR